MPAAEAHKAHLIVVLVGTYKHTSEKRPKLVTTRFSSNFKVKDAASTSVFYSESGLATGIHTALK